ncbi:hypothetical protein UlMin_022512 [Ulmus minor]
MDFPYRTLLFSSLLFSLSLLSVLSHSNFSPIDNYLVDCGSTVDSSVDYRRFVADSSSSNSPGFSFSSRSVSLRDENAVAGSSSQLYDTARVFSRPSKYEFEIRDEGTHMVRLHFQNLKSSKFDSDYAQFHVLIDDFVVLSNFSVGNSIGTSVVKEYLIWVGSDKLVIRFIPAQISKFAFVNAIEVISAPKDLVPETAKYLFSEKIEDFDGLGRQALEVVHRVNIGGPKVTPFNDTFFRTWLPDNEFLESSFVPERVYFAGRINYLKGGASREVGPDNVYKTARVIRSRNSSIPKINMTWEFPVIEGYKYLVRMHFCDIASISLGLLYFNVHVNGHMAYKDLDLSTVANFYLASPFYADFVVDSDDSGVLKVSVGPSNSSVPYAIDGILNGVEIMKMNNSMRSLDGPFCPGFVLRSWPAGHTGFLVPLVAAVCLLLSISMILRRKMFGTRETFGWSKLPVNVSEINMKNGF